MVLHASVVPQFGGLAASSEVSPETVRISAETALTNANAVAELAADLIALDIDPAQFPAFVGYTCYVSATIHMSMLSSTNPTLAMTARKGLTSTLKVLKQMKPAWTNLNRLVSVLLLCLSGLTVAVGTSACPVRSTTVSYANGKHG